MQFLFVALMSVLVVGSSLPRYFNLNKAAYSRRKASSANLVAIPQPKALLQEDVEQLANAEKIEEKTETSAGNVDQGVAQYSASSTGSQKSKVVSPSLDVELDREIASYVGPEGAMMIDEADLKSCVCQTEKLMRCNLWLEGACSDVDDFISVVARNPASDEFTKNFRCKEGNRFSGFLTVYGDQTLRMRVSFRDKIYQKDFSLTNHCGTLQNIKSSDDD